MEIIPRFKNVAIGGGALSMTPMVGDVFLDRFLPDRMRLIRAAKRRSFRFGRPR